MRMIVQDEPFLGGHPQRGHIGMPGEMRRTVSRRRKRQVRCAGKPPVQDIQHIPASVHQR
jgi:hypothetical protein